MPSFVAKSLFSRILRKCVARGEYALVSVALVMVALVLAVLAGIGWWSHRSAQEQAATFQRRQIELVGPMIAQNAIQLLKQNETTLLRRSIADTAGSYGLKTCRITLGDGKIVADAKPAMINESVIPDHWAATGADAALPVSPADVHLHYPLVVPGKGLASLDLILDPTPVGFDASQTWTGVGLFGSIGLALMLVVFRRSRSYVVEIEWVRDGLAAMATGEADVAALKIDTRLGDSAGAWNKLLDEVNDLRHRSVAQKATTAGGGRRSQSGSLEAACEAMSQGLILVDDQMKVRFSNGAACAFLRQDKSAMMGKPAVDLVVEEKFQESIRAIADGKLRRAVVIEIEQNGESGPGTLRFCIRPVRRGDADSAMIIVEDITQQRAAERARNSFVNQVTHELRTPLTNIRLYTETAIEDGDENPEVRANCLNVINLECRRLERIVGEMLSVAEMDAGSATVRKEDVYFEAVVEELRTDYQAQATDKNIELLFVLSPKLPKIQADRDKLIIALHNLIGNALKYTPEGGKVTVTADAKDNVLTIDVADTGIGIKPEEQDRIFDRFYRSNDPRVGKIVGTGLGLTLAREVIRLHGGDVTLRSEINQGSTFSAVIPLSAAA